MSTPNRYTPSIRGDMLEVSDGEWVRWEDYCETVRRMTEGEPVAVPTRCGHPPDARGLTGCLLCGATL